MLVLDLPSWFFKSVEKIQRRFFWRGQTEANVGSYLVAWRMVCLPEQNDGLGIHNLQRLNWALHTRWRWLDKRGDDLPWADLPIMLPEELEVIFAAGLRCTLGDGAGLRFWIHRCLPWGTNVEAITSNLMQFLACIARWMLVVEALPEDRWVYSI